MPSYTLSILAWLAVLATAFPAYSQEGRDQTDDTVRVVLVDGTSVIGVIEHEGPAEIVLRTESGIVMTIPHDQLKSLSAIGDGRYFRTDPNRTRLFFAPTGRAIGSGAGYVAFYEIVVPFVAVGAGSAVTLAGGVTINPGTGRLAYAAPKVTVLDRRTVSVAIGGIGATTIGIEDTGSAGLLFGVGTFGPTHSSVSLGIAFGFADGELGENPVFMLGGEHQVSNSVKLLTENYLLVGVDEGLLVSGGLRFFGDNLAADIGLVTLPILLTETEGFPFFPWLGFAYNFGHRD